MIYLSLAAGINNWKPRSIRLRPVMTAKMMSQNHKNTYIFSLNIFIPRTHKASRFWMVPEPPYLWNVHFVIRGNTLDIGSILFSWSIPVNRRTYENVFKFIYQFGYLKLNIIQVSITNMHFEISCYLHSKGGKFISQKPIGEKYLDNDVDKIEALT